MKAIVFFSLLAGLVAWPLLAGASETLLPMTEVRDAVLMEAGLATALRQHGAGQLEKDLLFMKAARYLPGELIAEYEGIYPATALRALHQLASEHHRRRRLENRAGAPAIGGLLAGGL